MGTVDLTALRRPAQPPPANTERARLSAEAAARAELSVLTLPTMLGKLTTWDAVQGYLPKIKIPSIFTDEHCCKSAIDNFKHWYVSTAYDRMQTQTKAITAAPIEVKKLDVKVAGVTFKPQQRKAIDGIIAAYQAGRGGAWLPLGTGRGKTFVAGGIIQWFKQQGLINNDNFILPQVFFFTKKSVAEATTEKLSQFFNLKCATEKRPSVDADILVSHYQALGTKRWAHYFRQDRIEVFGQGVEVDVWVPREKIVLIICDECHELKKQKSKRTRRLMGVFRAARAAGRRVFIVAMSATNATTLDDTRWFNFAAKLTDDNDATAFLQNFVSPTRGANTGSKIKAQMDRYIKALGPMYVRPPNDPLPYKIVTTCELIKFPSEDAEQFYRRAEQDYIESIEVVGGVVKNLDMAKFTIFRSAAEYLKAEWYAKRAYADVQAGRSVIIAVEFKRTLLKVLAILGSMGVPREKISIIKGNDQIIQQHEVYTDMEFAALLSRQDRELTQYREDNEGEEPDDPWFFLSRKEKAKVKKTRKYNQDMVRAGETRFEQIERTKWLLNMELGNQSDEQRHKEVKRFLNNDTHYLLMTFATGGTGIDADDRIPKEQGGRPRTTLCTVCYWAEQWLQGLGRDARLTTLTDPWHVIAMFERSIESEHVLPTLSKRLDSMAAMTGGAGDLEGLLAQAIMKSGKSTDFASEFTGPLSSASTDIIVDEADTDEDEDDDED